MSFTTGPLKVVLDRLTNTIPVSVKDYDGSGEWFWVTADELWDEELFQKLKTRWPKIAGAYLKQFALVYCEAGADYGVWLHYLGTPTARKEYAIGCHQVESWE
jgi:hypothetical protein